MALKRLDFSAGVLRGSPCESICCFVLMLGLFRESADGFDLSRCKLSNGALPVPEPFFNNWIVRALTDQRSFISIKNNTDLVAMSLNSMTALLNVVNVSLNVMLVDIACRAIALGDLLLILCNCFSSCALES